MSIKDLKDAAEKCRLYQAKQLIKALAIEEMKGFMTRYGELNELSGVFAAMKKVIESTEANGEESVFRFT